MILAGLPRRLDRHNASTVPPRIPLASPRRAGQQLRGQLGGLGSTRGAKAGAAAVRARALASAHAQAGEGGGALVQPVQGAVFARGPSRPFAFSLSRTRVTACYN